MPTTVVNRKHTNAYDLYIGRPGPYGNLYRIGADGDRATVIEKFRDWWYSPLQKGLRLRARRECTGKVLGCWCPPLPCHGHVIVEYCDCSTWNTCPDCGVEWPDADPSPSVLHRTVLCTNCAAPVETPC